MRKEAAEPAKGASSAKSKSSSSTSTVSKAPLSEEEKAQRKQLGMLFMCWSIIGFSLLDSFVFYDMIYKKIGLPGLVPFSGILLGGPLAFVFFLTHVKGK
jgi:hypothetical protein